MKKHQIIHLVKNEDLNLHGTLFAARAAAWFVEAGFVTAAIAHGKPDELVCISTHEMVFKKPIPNGDIIRFTGQIVHVGTTSITVSVDIVSELTGDTKLQGFTSFVSIDHETGKKKPHCITLDETGDDAELKKRAEAKALLL